MGTAPHPYRKLGLAGGVLGFALGGFFDGILLHQVLQWHHFLSLVPGEALRDLRAQVFADGMFHVAVYLIAMLGLLLLWQARAMLAERAGSRLLGAALLGFAAWQIVDVVVFHWLLGIHRIRVDVPDPLFWDIGWLLAVGLPPLLVGLWLRRQGPPGGRHGGAAAFTLVALVLAAMPVAALPPAGSTTMLVLFRPGIPPGEAFAAVIASGGRVAWSDPSGGLLAVDTRDGVSMLDLYRRGALLVGRSAATGGCLAWTRISV
ncbi:DUF2243 domain-containing protein [Roseomonas sp. SSH11]|uniref:DUF2243 domain-containing protein n=1 Tax=Pararoseomonas baculiformis TaxID=2820812 RepID=A0ABS4AE52_9PROT|nr:DUF2243 domain-containing protein [Pararoseomonas baculiformis]MBP0445274.1 DUF2243 domain-containing protein [Pararoseomonas baculiformis]